MVFFGRLGGSGGACFAGLLPVGIRDSIKVRTHSMDIYRREVPSAVRRVAIRVAKFTVLHR